MDLSAILSPPQCSELVRRNVSLAIKGEGRIEGFLSEKDVEQSKVKAFFAYSFKRPPMAEGRDHPFVKRCLDAKVAHKAIFDSHNRIETLVVIKLPVKNPTKKNLETFKKFTDFLSLQAKESLIGIVEIFCLTDSSLSSLRIPTPAF